MCFFSDKNVINIAIRLKRPYLCHQIVWRELLHSFLESTVVGKLTIFLCWGRFDLWSVLLVEETGVPGENQLPAVSQ